VVVVVGAGGWVGGRKLGGGGVEGGGGGVGSGGVESGMLFSLSSSHSGLNVRGERGGGFKEGGGAAGMSAEWSRKVLLVRFYPPPS